MNRQFLRVLLVFACVLCRVPAQAQGQQPATPPPPYQAPAMRFDAKGMTLIDAVKLTLEHDPTIKLRQADVELRSGVLRSEKGLFDYVFNANGSFSREQTQLSDGEKSDLQQTRDDLAAAVGEVGVISQSLTSAAAILNDKNLVANNPAGMNLSGIKDVNVLNQMALLQSQLVTYKDLLASATLTDPKVRADVAALRDATVAKNLEYVNLQQASTGAASSQLQTDITNLGDTPEDRWEKFSDFHFDVSKTFRNGLNLKPFGDLTYSSQNYVGKAEIDKAFGGMGVSPRYTGKLGFDVVLPLLRGSGSRSVAAFETAAKYDLEASRLAMLQQKSQSVLATVLAYWQARAAADQVEVQRRSVEIQGELGTITRALIAANEKPRAEEARVLAATADARSRYEAAQRALTDTRISLAQSMGVALADALSLPLASESYPMPGPDLAIDPNAYLTLAREAVAKRFDHQAALKVEASGKSLVEGARIDTRPLLNLNGSVWGTSLSQTASGLSHWVFRSGKVGAEFQVPFGNNSAQGLLEQRLSQLNRSKIDSANLERTITLNVVQLAETLSIAASRLRAALEAVTNYDQTVLNEKARYKAGDSSLVDAILTEQQATTARAAYISAQQDYAMLLASLRYEAGLLVQDGVVDAPQLIAVPAALVRR
jgi:outer membrane protein TolC